MKLKPYTINNTTRRDFPYVLYRTNGSGVIAYFKNRKDAEKHAATLQ